MVEFIQIKLNKCKVAQDSLEQTIYESELQTGIMSEPHRIHDGDVLVIDATIVIVI